VWPKGGRIFSSFNDTWLKNLTPYFCASRLFCLHFIFYRYVTTYKIVINTTINILFLTRWGYYAVWNTRSENISFLPRQSSNPSTCQIETLKSIYNNKWNCDRTCLLLKRYLVLLVDFRFINRTLEKETRARDKH
jgi:hypothetical protein